MTTDDRGTDAVAGKDDLLDGMADLVTADFEVPAAGQVRIAQHLKVDHGVQFARGKVHINGLEGFWSYAKAKFIKHHGVSPAKFPLYLYEWQFRYNHRHDDLFEHLLTASLKSVPDL